MASPFTDSHSPICNRRSSNAGMMRPSAVGPTFNNMLPPQLTKRKQHFKTSNIEQCYKSQMESYCIGYSHCIVVCCESRNLIWFSHCRLSANRPWWSSNFHPKGSLFDFWLNILEIIGFHRHNKYPSTFSMKHLVNSHSHLAQASDNPHLTVEASW